MGGCIAGSPLCKNLELICGCPSSVTVTCASNNTLEVWLLIYVREYWKGDYWGGTSNILNVPCENILAWDFFKKNPMTFKCRKRICVSEGIKQEIQCQF